MNVYISHSSTYDYENELYKPIKDSSLSNGHNFFLPHEPQHANTSAKAELQRMDVLVAEVSLPSTGQGIELAQAEAAGVPILCFYKTGSHPTSSLCFVTKTIVEYTNVSDLLIELESELAKLSKS